MREVGYVVDASIGVSVVKPLDRPVDLEIADLAPARSGSTLLCFLHTII